MSLNPKDSKYLEEIKKLYFKETGEPLSDGGAEDILLRIKGFAEVLIDMSLSQEGSKS